MKKSTIYYGIILASLSITCPSISSASSKEGLSDFAQPLKEMTNEEGRKEISKIINSVPQNERENLLKQARQLFTPKMRWEDRIKIVDSMKTIASTERSMVVQEIKKDLTKAKISGKLNATNKDQYILMLCEYYDHSLAVGSQKPTIDDIS